MSWLRNGRKVQFEAVPQEDRPSDDTLEARLGAVISFYRWQAAVHDVPVARRLLKGAPRRAPARGLLSHLDARTTLAPSSLVRVRRTRRRDRPPILLLQQVQAIMDGCAIHDGGAGEWVGNLRDRLLFALLAETGMRLGESLGMRIGDLVMGRGGTPYVEVVPRDAGIPDAIRGSRRESASPSVMRDARQAEPRFRGCARPSNGTWQPCWSPARWSGRRSSADAFLP
ncbi:hypothetical protein ABZ297_45130 [Nonomuraea sp. NPDC005983]|uniref:hypothetical protein n=1 Tax=Nonomuraea sp. NPDC005983 TaxID=3155595 RepID=UPI00339E9777